MEAPASDTVLNATTAAQVAALAKSTKLFPFAATSTSPPALPALSSTPTTPTTPLALRKPPVPATDGQTATSYRNAIEQVLKKDTAVSTTTTDLDGCVRKKRACFPRETVERLTMEIQNSVAMNQEFTIEDVWPMDAPAPKAPWDFGGVLRSSVQRRINELRKKLGGEQPERRGIVLPTHVRAIVKTTLASNIHATNKDVELALQQGGQFSEESPIPPRKNILAYASLLRQRHSPVSGTGRWWQDAGINLLTQNSLVTPLGLSEGLKKVLPRGHDRLWSYLLLDNAGQEFEKSGTIRFAVDAKTRDDVKAWVNDHKELTHCDWSIIRWDVCTGAKILLSADFRCRYRFAPKPDAEKSDDSSQEATGCTARMQAALLGSTMASSRHPRHRLLLYLQHTHNHGFEVVSSETRTRGKRKHDSDEE